MKFIATFNFVLFVVILFACSGSVMQHRLLTADVKQYGKAEFTIDLNEKFENPYDRREVSLDMILESPSGKTLVLPCFYDEDQGEAVWRARFTPQDAGTYTYKFNLQKNGKKSAATGKESFQSLPGSGDGFLHVRDYWTFAFDSGKPFRGIGENVGWESRSFEDEKWTYDYLLPTLSQHGANFFRTWMCVWNLPVAFPNVNDTKRYADSNKYFNDGGIRRMDELVQLCDSLGLNFMISLDAHGSLMPDGYWKFNAHNSANGGPAESPEEFFTNEESREMYKNRLRYIVARWGYSPSIAAWEFFNEIDNAVFTPTPHDSVLISHDIVTEWHDEMSRYLKSIDPYGHIVTTSVSHREIDGMNDLKNIDLNQKHIYNKTHLIAPTISRFTDIHKKPYVIGEFGYDWNWDNVKHEYGEGFDHDYRRGLWYGLFSPTPVLPMTWWWEFFDERKMTPYFNGVRQISDRMLEAGKGSFEQQAVSSGRMESYAVRCQETYFVYLLNNTDAELTTPVSLERVPVANYRVEYFDPAVAVYAGNDTVTSFSGRISSVRLKPRQERILIITPAVDDRLKAQTGSN